MVPSNDLGQPRSPLTVSARNTFGKSLDENIPEAGQRGTPWKNGDGEITRHGRWGGGGRVEGKEYKRSAWYPVVTLCESGESSFLVVTGEPSNGEREI